MSLASSFHLSPAVSQEHCSCKLPLRERNLLFLPDIDSNKMIAIPVLSVIAKVTIHYMLKKANRTLRWTRDSLEQDIP